MVNGRYYNIYGETELRIGDWYHIALTFDGYYFRLYINGNEDSSKKVIGKFSPSSRKSNFFVGVESDGKDPDDEFFIGNIRNIEVFNKSLSKNEILNLMSNTNYKNQLGGLIQSWPQ